MARPAPIAYPLKVELESVDEYGRIETYTHTIATGEQLRDKGLLLTTGLTRGPAGDHVAGTRARVRITSMEPPA